MQKEASLQSVPCSISHLSTVNHAENISAALTALTHAGLSRFALVTLTLHFDSQSVRKQTAATRIEESKSYYQDNLRNLVRKSDYVLRFGQTLHFLLVEADEQGATIVQDRLWEALLWRVHNAQEQHILQPTMMAIGYGVWPGPQVELQSCVQTAAAPRLRFVIQTRPDSSTEQNIDHYQLARQLGVPYLSLLPKKIPPRVQQICSPALALELHCYPLGRERNTLTVAMSDPNDRRVLTRLQQETGLRIFPVLTPPQELQMALEQLV
jgi:hypothetical protein